MTQNIEPNKNILDNFIDKELEIKPNPFLSAKVMDKIAAQNNESLNKSIDKKTTHTFVFKITMATSAAAILALGVFLGSNYTYLDKYNNQDNNSLALNINDTQLENLYLYSVDE